MLAFLAIWQIVSLVFTGGSDLGADETTVAPAEDEQQLQRLYEGRTLAEWKAWVKVLVPGSEASVQAVPALIAIVGDDQLSGHTRRQMALTLGRIGQPAAAAIPVLIKILDETASDDAETRSWVFKALAHFGSVAASATPRLTARLADANCTFQDAIGLLDTLSQIGTAHSKVLPTLVEVLNGRLPVPQAPINAAERHELRAAAAESIMVLGPAADSAVPALIRTLDEEVEIIRRKTAAALGAIGQQAQPAIPALASTMAFDSSPAVRDAAAEALAGIGAPAVPILQHLLSDPDAGVRWRAAAGLGTIGRAARPATGALQERFTDPEDLVRITALEAYWKITQQADALIPNILSEFSNEDRQMRIRAYRLLIEMGPAAHAAVEPLRAMLNDPRATVRQAARQALRELPQAPRD